jgi:L-fuconolactonase
MPPTMNNPVMRIDSHQHFWRYRPEEYRWIDERMAVLKRDYMPEDLKPLLQVAKFDGTVTVQARQNVEETRWLLELAGQHDFIRGVVGWVDLCSAELDTQLESFAGNPKLVGVRHVVHDEPDDEFMLRPEFRRGIAQLGARGLTYDLLLFPRHLPVALQLVQEFPAQRFVLDHIGKPRIGERSFLPWQEGVAALAECPNVWCKLSGLVTEAKWKQWQPDDFCRYLDTVFYAFGLERLMIGSDWPVCGLSGDYANTMRIVIDYLRQYPPADQSRVLGGNCTQFYRLKQTPK